MKIFLLMLLLMAAPTFGQTIDELKTRAKKEKISNYLTFGFDRFTDQSVILTKPTTIHIDTKAGVLGMLAGCSSAPPTTMTMFGIQFEGNTLKDIPAEYFMHVTTTARGGSNVNYIGEDTTLYMIVDEKREERDPGKTYLERTMFSGLRDGVIYTFTREDVDKIANAKKVEVKFGPKGIVAELHSDVKKRLRALLTITAKPD